LVIVASFLPGPSAVVARWGSDAGAAEALRVAAALAVGRGLPLIVDDGERPGRRAVAAVAELVRLGLPASTGVGPADALVVAADQGGDEPPAGAQIAVRAEPDADPLPVDEWAAELTASGAETDSLPAAAAPA
jgi:hypothetical protein